MPASPRLSVILPAFNGRRFIAEALDSVLSQRPAPHEVWVVDDGSTDGTGEILRQFEPHVFVARQTRRGVAAARNRGLELSTGDVVGFIDQDDIWPPGRVEKQCAAFAADPARDVVLGRIQYLLLKGAASQPFGEPVVALHPGCALFRRAALDRAGRFRSIYPLAEDLDLFIRVWESGARLCVFPEVSLLYRRHESSTTFGLTPAEQGFARVVGDSIRRRRENGFPVAALRPIEFANGARA